MFLNSALGEGEWLASRAGRFIPGSHWLGSRAGLGAMNRKNPCLSIPQDCHYICSFS